VISSRRVHSASKRNSTSMSVSLQISSKMGDRMTWWKITNRYSVHLWFGTNCTRIWSLLFSGRRVEEWKRVRKLELIESTNPNWQDLYHKIVDWIPAFAGMTRKGNRCLLVSACALPHLPFPDSPKRLVQARARERRITYDNKGG